MATGRIVAEVRQEAGHVTRHAFTVTGDAAELPALLARKLAEVGRWAGVLPLLSLEAEVMGAVAGEWAAFPIARGVRP